MGGHIVQIMATITRSNIGPLHEKITVTLVPGDYVPAFEQGLKKYAKTATIQGFRKGMVPAGLIKKMYGQSVFTDEVLRTVESELNKYLQAETLDIFAQPLPLETEKAPKLDMTAPQEYNFEFEIGLKPTLNIDLSKTNFTRYKIEATEAMLEEEIARLQTRHGIMSTPEEVSKDEEVLNLDFLPANADGTLVEDGAKKSNSLIVKYFAEAVRPQLIGKKVGDTLTIQLKEAFETKELEWVLSDLGLDKLNAADSEKYYQLTITKIGFVEKAELGEELYGKAFPNKEIKTEEEFKAAVKADIEGYFVGQSSNQLHDQIYHGLLNTTPMELPEAFLKRWLQTGGEKPKTAEEAEAEYPSFAKQLAWTIISNQLINEHKIAVERDELKAFAKQQMLGYMNMGSMDDAPWLDEYVNRMMSDKKYVENTYFQVQTDKLFRLLETQITATEQAITPEAFGELVKNHQH